MAHRDTLRPKDYPYGSFGPRALIYAPNVSPVKPLKEVYVADLMATEYREEQAEYFCLWKSWKDANLVASAVVPDRFAYPSTANKRLHRPVIDVDHPASIRDGILWLGMDFGDEELESLISGLAMLKVTSYSCEPLEMRGEVGVPLSCDDGYIRLVTSLSPDHRHLYVEGEFSNEDYLGEDGALTDLASSGWVEPGYLWASRKKNYSAVRIINRVP